MLLVFGLNFLSDHHVFRLDCELGHSIGSWVCGGTCWDWVDGACQLKSTGSCTPMIINGILRQSQYRLVKHRFPPPFAF
uniref:Uncharacterized protein n=1 Tax=Anguilla anguilla TaxID=7936 RepID=A0A0E9WV61_ANGAN